MNRARALLLVLPVTLAACTGTDPTLGITQPAAPGAPPAAADVALTPPPAGAIPANAVAIAFAPVTGIATAQAAELNTAINAGAAARGIAVAAAGDPAARYLVKGYLSALAETGKTSVIYVFDVLDPAGNRLHRIQGSEASAAPAGTDAWASVTPETMRRIGDSLLSQLAQWSAANRG